MPFIANARNISASQAETKFCGRVCVFVCARARVHVYTRICTFLVSALSVICKQIKDKPRGNYGSDMGVERRHKNGGYSYWCGRSESLAVSASVQGQQSAGHGHVSCTVGSTVSIQSRLVLLGDLGHDSTPLVPLVFQDFSCLFIDFMSYLIF